MDDITLDRLRKIIAKRKMVNQWLENDLIQFVDGMIGVQKQTCLRCGYEFFPSPDRDDQRKIVGIILPKSCPNYSCRSPYWMKPRQVKGSDNV